MAVMADSPRNCEPGARTHRAPGLGSADDGARVLKRAWPAIPDSVTMARRALATFAEGAGVQGVQLDAVRLAASEALTNVVVHAYPAGQAGLIHVAAAVSSGELWFVIADDGGGMRARTDSPGLGHGLMLIADACDELTILQRSGGGTELRMLFGLRCATKQAHDAAAEDGGAIQSRESVASATSPASPRLTTTA
jgi:anti-sigma regulatory factor (Ser/Thr protein kinase)